MKHGLRSLVGMALQSRGSAQSWTAVMSLQMSGSPETLELTGKLWSSRNWRKRALAMDIVAQLQTRTKGAPYGGFEYALEATQLMLLEGLNDSHPEVVRCAISGMAHRPHVDGLSPILGLAHHPDENIRFAVAVALGSYLEPSSTEMRCELANDEDDDVRDWATFGLGSLHEVDTQEVRATLWRKLNDPDADVRGEALVGLANRKDERVIPVLLSLQNSDSRVYELDAAEALANAQLLGRLVELRQEAEAGGDLHTYWYGHLLDAIEACQVPDEIPSRS